MTKQHVYFKYPFSCDLTSAEANSLKEYKEKSTKEKYV